MSKELRNKVIRLAHAKPELRKDLLPLLKKSYGRKDTLSRMIERAGAKWGVSLTHTYNDPAGYYEYSFRGDFQKKNGTMVAEAFKIHAYFVDDIYDVVYKGRELASFNSDGELYQGIYDVLPKIFGN